MEPALGDDITFGSLADVPATPVPGECLPALDFEETTNSGQSSSHGEEELAAQASAEAGRWRLERGAAPASLCLTDRLRRASAHIQGSLEASPSRSALSGQFGLGTPLAATAFENAALLRTAGREVGEYITHASSLPQVRVGVSRLALPRVYAAALAFVRTAEFRMDARSLTVYFQALQRHGKWQLAELHALRPLLQLALLEELAAALRSSGPQNAGRKALTETRIAALASAMRDVPLMNWSELLEGLSAVEAVLQQDLAYCQMDAESRDFYRAAIVELASHSERNETQVASAALSLATRAGSERCSNHRLRERRAHVGYYLIDKGRQALEEEICYRPPLLRRVTRWILANPAMFYFTGIGALTLALIAFVLAGSGLGILSAAACLLLFLPAVDAAVGAMNQLTAFLLPPRLLPKLDFSTGIPAECATLVAVPILLLNEEQVRQAARDLEIRFAGNIDPHLHFALVTDSPDSPSSAAEPENLIQLCASLIEDLNRKYRGYRGGSFFCLHRPPMYNRSEGVWMGWERKRGKLLDLNRLLLRLEDRFAVKRGDLSILSRIRYVITLDADTQLPRDAARKMVGTLAHPLNRAIVDPRTNTVVEGYGILQPRVGISVRSVNRSLLANLYSRYAGWDAYTRAVSDVYQDLFGEGSFAGKGIYEVAVFQRVLSNRLPVNAILSHDLIEGAYARAGLVSDIEVIDDYPSHFSAYSRRKHRWVRGDWQIARWLLPRVPTFAGKLERNPIHIVSRWKICDNLRRSLMESAVFAVLLGGWIGLPGGAGYWTAAVLFLILLPAYLRLLLVLSTLPAAANIRATLASAAEGFVTEQVNAFMMLAFLAHQVLVTLDAIFRTIVRLTITRRRLLEWETAAQSELGGKRAPVDRYLKCTPLMAGAIGLLLAVWRPGSLATAAPILLLWACSTFLARWLNRPLRAAKKTIQDQDEQLLQETGLRTWRFFKTFSDARTSWLVPDNVEENRPAHAQRISPTNLGLLLNARVAAHELGFLTLTEFAEATEKTMATALRLKQYNGHLFNWYDTRTLRPLAPFFVSTVDSGNLACCLWTVKQACLHFVDRPLLDSSSFEGARLCLRLVRDACASQVRAASSPAEDSLLQILEQSLLLPDDLEAWLRAAPELESSLKTLIRAPGEEPGLPGGDASWLIEESISRLSQMHCVGETLLPFILPEHSHAFEHPELQRLVGQIPRLTLASLPQFLVEVEESLARILGEGALTEAGRDERAPLESLLRAAQACGKEAKNLLGRLRTIAEEADAWVRRMDFRSLYNPHRQVLSLGYSVERRTLERTCYDLLASEARTAAFVAVAKGDAPQDAWYRLGRRHALCGKRPALLSWTGTMFEYLMPALWMRTYPNTMLHRAVTSAVCCHSEISKTMSVPWGISESAYRERDSSGSYRYHAFGLPALALRPDLSDALVISPYSSFLALAVDSRAAVANIRKMWQMGWTGAYGFYESADYAHADGGVNGEGQLVRCWMAHHQGMILLAICNALKDSAIRNLFHAEPMVAATERLLQERAVAVVCREDLQKREPRSAVRFGRAA